MTGLRDWEAEWLEVLAMSDVAGSYNLDNMTGDRTTTNEQDTGQTRTGKQDSTGPAGPGQGRPPDTATEPRRDDRQTDRPTDDHAGRQTDRDTDGDTDRQPDRQPDRRTDDRQRDERHRTGRTSRADRTTDKQTASKQTGGAMGP